MNLDTAEAIARPMIKEFIEGYGLEIPILKRLTHSSQKFGKSWAIIVGIDLSTDNRIDQAEWFRVIVNEATGEADIVIQVEWDDLRARLPHA